jgi:hypothetical protein
VEPAWPETAAQQSILPIRCPNRPMQVVLQMHPMEETTESLNGSVKPKRKDQDAGTPITADSGRVV